MILKNGQTLLEKSEIRNINKMFKKWLAKDDPLKGAKIGEHIGCSAVFTCYSLKTKKTDEKFIIKVIIPSNCNAEKIFNKTVRVRHIIADSLGEDSSFLNYEQCFVIGDNHESALYCFIEKRVGCADHYIASSLNKIKDDVEIAVRIGSDLLPLLQTLKEHQIVHRDIKPSNIFLKGKTPADGIMLGNFIASTNLNEENTSCTTQSVRGTPTTIAPEAVCPYGEDFKDLSKIDMYSLGITMYYFLNNRNFPFVNMFDKDGFIDMALLLKERKDGCFPPRNGSAHLKQIVLKAIEYYPEDRFSSYDEMLEELKKTEEYKMIMRY